MSKAAPPAPKAPPAPRRRGRPPQITLEQVITAASAIAPAELTVQAVADALGVTRAAIYHYVADADELRTLTARATLPPFTVPTGPGTTWQEWMCEFAHAAWEWQLSQGAVLRVIALELVDLPWFLRILDEGLDLLVQAGFSERRAGEAVQFMAGVMWINSQDMILSSQSPGGVHPQAASIARATRGSTTFRHIHDGDGTSMFTGKDRFDREIAWVVSALERDLEQELSRRRARPGRARRTATR